MALTLQKLVVQQNVQLLTPPQSLGLRSFLHQQKWKICIGYCKKMVDGRVKMEKMALTLQKFVIGWWQVERDTFP